MTFCVLLKHFFVAMKNLRWVVINISHIIEIFLMKMPDVGQAMLVYLLKQQFKFFIYRMPIGILV